jgi:hypothetical protein
MLTALVSTIEANSETTGPDRRLLELIRRRGAEDGEGHELYCKEAAKRHAGPATKTGTAQLRATVNSSCWNKSAVLNPLSALKSSVVSQVSTLVDPRSLLVCIIMV